MFYKNADIFVNKSNLNRIKKILNIVETIL